MHIESINNYSQIHQPPKHSNVANAEEIKSILYLGIKCDVPSSEQKRKVDIII